MWKLVFRFLLAACLVGLQGLEGTGLSSSRSGCATADEASRRKTNWRNDNNDDHPVYHATYVAKFQRDLGDACSSKGGVIRVQCLGGSIVYAGSNDDRISCLSSTSLVPEATNTSSYDCLVECSNQQACRDLESNLNVGVIVFECTGDSPTDMDAILSYDDTCKSQALDQGLVAEQLQLSLDCPVEFQAQDSNTRHNVFGHKINNTFTASNSNIQLVESHTYGRILADTRCHGRPVPSAKAPEIREEIVQEQQVERKLGWSRRGRSRQRYQLVFKRDLATPDCIRYVPTVILQCPQDSELMLLSTHPSSDVLCYTDERNVSEASCMSSSTSMAPGVVVYECRAEEKDLLMDTTVKFLEQQVECPRYPDIADDVARHVLNLGVLCDDSDDFRFSGTFASCLSGLGYEEAGIAGTLWLECYNSLPCRARSRHCAGTIDAVEIAASASQCLEDLVGVNSATLPSDVPSTVPSVTPRATQANKDYNKMAENRDSGRTLTKRSLSSRYLSDVDDIEVLTGLEGLISVSDYPSNVPSDIPSTIPSAPPSMTDASQEHFLPLELVESSDVIQLKLDPSDIPSTIPTASPPIMTDTGKDNESALPFETVESNDTTHLKSESRKDPKVGKKGMKTLHSKKGSGKNGNLDGHRNSEEILGDRSDILDAAVAQSDFPSIVPSDLPSTIPSDFPSTVPSDFPSSVPSDIPSNVPSTNPSANVKPPDLSSDYPSIVPSSWGADYSTSPPFPLDVGAIMDDDSLPQEEENSSSELFPSDYPSIVPSSWGADYSTSPPFPLGETGMDDDEVMDEANSPSSVPLSVFPSSTPSDFLTREPSTTPSTAGYPSKVPSSSGADDATSTADPRLDPVLDESMTSNPPSSPPIDFPSQMPSGLPSDTSSVASMKPSVRNKAADIDVPASSLPSVSSMAPSVENVVAGVDNDLNHETMKAGSSIPGAPSDAPSRYPTSRAAVIFDSDNRIVNHHGHEGYYSTLMPSASKPPRTLSSEAPSMSPSPAPSSGPLVVNSGGVVNNDSSSFSGYFSAAVPTSLDSDSLPPSLSPTLVEQLLPLDDSVNADEIDEVREQADVELVAIHDDSRPIQQRPPATTISSQSTTVAKSDKEKADTQQSAEGGLRIPGFLDFISRLSNFSKKEAKTTTTKASTAPIDNLPSQREEETDAIFPHQPKAAITPDFSAGPASSGTRMTPCSFGKLIWLGTGLLLRLFWTMSNPPFSP